MSKLASIGFIAVAAVLVACGGSAAHDDKTSSSPSDPAPSGSATGGSSGSGPTVTIVPADSACGATTKTLCERACACNTSASGACVVAYGVVTEDHKSLRDCENFYALWVCGQPQYAKPYDDATCSAALGTAACVETKASGGALAFPDACRGSK